LIKEGISRDGAGANRAAPYSFDTIAQKSLEDQKKMTSVWPLFSKARNFALPIGPFPGR